VALAALMEIEQRVLALYGMQALIIVPANTL
jgi:hypothetical protein